VGSRRVGRLTPLCLTDSRTGGFSLRPPERGEMRVLVLQECGGEVERKGEGVGLHKKIAERIATERRRRHILFFHYAAFPSL
jgi:hypothetical protein